MPGGFGCTGMKTVRCGGSGTDMRRGFSKVWPIVVVHSGMCWGSTAAALAH